jgi:hypothetical protein
MAYPTVKAGTTHVDAGSDSPKQARADIKQNIDNVNALIDHFNGTGPISIQDNEITSTRSNDDLILQASGTGKVASPETINFNTVGRVIITDQTAGTFSTESSSSIGMLYNNGIQVEAAGAYEYPALVLKTFSVNGYPNIWAARSKNNTFGQNTHLEDNDKIFEFFGAGFDGTDYNTPHAKMELKAAEDHTGSAQGAKMVFNTTTNGTKTLVARMTIDDTIASEVQHEFNKNYKEKINAISATSGSVSVDTTVAPVHTMTLNDNTTYTFTGMEAGTSTLLIIKLGAADKTASFTSDGSTLVKFSGGAPTLSTTSGHIDIVSVFFDGTDYIGSILQGIR